MLSHVLEAPLPPQQAHSSPWLTPNPPLALHGPVTCAQLTEAALAERMSALRSLLPLPGPKVADFVLRRPLVLVRSPRALANQIGRLAEELQLDSWTAASMVAGQPSILGSSIPVLARR